MTALYLDTSVALRAILEQGTTPDFEARIAAATVLVTSRLSLVESARALIRVRLQGGVAEARLADARRELDALWSRCELWELSQQVCDLASSVARDTALRTLDALHLATFLLARRRIEGLELVTCDERLEGAADSG
ncbi:MAG TPA: type II toxin-antitoxin system VapC family toxin [Thermoanaerobaculia bacterium]|nr:type II toxin-antitoxin system VapC family toxin [Thermoanaerobaculia bacterium]